MYATALTAACATNGFDIVDPSAVIAARMEDDATGTVPEVSIRDASDRIGVEITGREAAAKSVSVTLTSCSVDTIAIDAALSRGGIYVGEVDRTNQSGAIVDTGVGTGFLPFGKADGYVDDGDRLVVQLIDPEPPWATSRRPVLASEVRLPGTYLSLAPGDAGEIISAPSDELAFVVQRIDAELPAGWGIVVHGRAEQVDPTVLAAELRRLGDNVETVEKALAAVDTADDIGRVIEPLTTIWCRFGREGRFALDTRRGDLTPTITGHHRIKSIGADGGRAVDLLEGYGLTDVVFDPDVVFDTFGPRTGDRLRIEHGKPTGETIVLGEGEVVDRESEGTVSVERTLSGGGTYDALDVPKVTGDRAETTFVEGRWWYPTVYRSSDGAYKGTYVNVCTPIEILPDRVRYLDLDVDVVKSPDDEVRIVDREELRNRVTDGVISETLGERAESVAEAIVRAF